MPAISSKDDPNSPMKVIVVFNDGSRWEIEQNEIQEFQLTMGFEPASLSKYNIDFSFFGYKNTGF